MTSKAKRRFDGGDYALGGFLFSITAGALFLPWHAYTSPESYARPEMVFSRQAELDGSEIAHMVGGRTLFDLRSQEFVASAPLSQVDPVTTGSVSAERKPRKVRNVLDSPRRASDLTLLAGDRRRALVMDTEGIYLARPNERLPGGARVRALINRDGTSRLITTRFEVLRVAGDR